MSNPQNTPFGDLVGSLSDSLTKALTLAKVAQTGLMYLEVTGARQGPLKGDIEDPKHEGAIEVRSWNWGMLSGDVMHGGAGAARGAKTLTIYKRIDTSTTQLMMAMYLREKLEEVKLVMARSTTNDSPDITVKLVDAQVVTIDVQGMPDGSVIEKVEFSFTEIEFIYNGMRRGNKRTQGGFVFMGDFGPERDD